MGSPSGNFVTDSGLAVSRTNLYSSSKTTRDAVRPKKAIVPNGLAQFYGEDRSSILVIMATRRAAGVQCRVILDRFYPNIPHDSGGAPSP